MANYILIVLAYCFVLLLFLVTSIVKAMYHMKYLKVLFPNRYCNYQSFFSVFTMSNYNVGLQFLVLPYFRRTLAMEDANSKSIAEKVRMYQCLSLLFFALLILPIIIGILN